ncbi:type VI secretion system tip protein TssI/VgrG [Pseudomonas aeruginosa]|nr:type VI secretion system tip protein TssI/VgrG [Pseudomonas aeruginosa]
MFQNLATSDIVTQVFDQHGFSDYQLQLSGSYQPREYLRAVRRERPRLRLAAAGGRRHLLVLHPCRRQRCPGAGRQQRRLPPIPNGPQVAYLGQGIGVRELQGVRSAQYSLQAVSGTYSATDYEFTTPGTSLYSQAEAVSGAAGVYQHPGGYTAKAQGDSLTKQRIDGLRSQETRLIGESDCRWLVPGHWFTLSGHDDDSLNIDWVLTSVTHDASHAHYRNRFEAIPKATAYRPARSRPSRACTPRPPWWWARPARRSGPTSTAGSRSSSPGTATARTTRASSCWVRVVLPWSGKGFGMQFVPRIGQEVIVTFIDGDPDRPLVTGCVYNGDNALPYALPDNQAQSGIKTNSSKGGGGFNELRFEDKKDAEEVFLQAQKDLNVNVLNDSTASIGHDETLTVQNARTRTVKEGDETVTWRKASAR